MMNDRRWCGPGTRPLPEEIDGMRTCFLLSILLAMGSLSCARAAYVIDDRRDDGTVEVATCTLTEKTRTVTIRVHDEPTFFELALPTTFAVSAEAPRALIPGYEGPAQIETNAFILPATAAGATAHWTLRGDSVCINVNGIFKERHVAESAGVDAQGRPQLVRARNVSLGPVCTDTCNTSNPG